MDRTEYAEAWDNPHVPATSGSSENQGTAIWKRGSRDTQSCPARALALSGDPCRPWQALNKLGFVTGLLRDLEDDKQEALGQQYLAPGGSGLGKGISHWPGR